MNSRIALIDKCGFFRSWINGWFIFDLERKKAGHPVGRAPAFFVLQVVGQA